MDLRHKHHALIWTGLLVLIFLGIVAWYLLRDRELAVPAPGVPVATSTPEALVTPPHTLNESGRFYEISAKYPSATPLTKDANEAALATMESFVRDQARSFSTNANPGLISPEEAEMVFPGGRKYTLDIDYSTVTGSRIVTYTFNIYADTLGAHPNTNFRTFTFDTQTGAQLALADLFLPSSQYLERLSIRARNELARSIHERTRGTEINERMLSDGTQPIPDNFQWFRIDGTSLVLIFPPYQVGPYALGTLEASIPLAQLSEALKPEYRP